HREQTWPHRPVELRATCRSLRAVASSSSSASGFLCQAMNFVDQTFNLIGRGVTGAPDAYDTVLRPADSLDDGLGVEIAVRDEQAFLGQTASDFVGGHAAQSKGDRRCAWRARPGTVQ